MIEAKVPMIMIETVVACMTPVKGSQGRAPCDILCKKLQDAGYKTTVQAVEAMQLRASISTARILLQVAVHNASPPPARELTKEMWQNKNIMRDDTPVHSSGHAPPDQREASAESAKKFSPGNLTEIPLGVYPNCCKNPTLSMFSAHTFSHCQSANAAQLHIGSTGAMAAAERLNYTYGSDRSNRKFP